MKRANGGGKGLGKGSKVCYECGKAGHIARDCLINKKDPRRRNQCGKIGHIAKDCRAPFPTRETEEQENEEAINRA